VPSTVSNRARDFRDFINSNDRLPAPITIDARNSMVSTLEFRMIFPIGWSSLSEVAIASDPLLPAFGMRLAISSYVSVSINIHLRQSFQDLGLGIGFYGEFVQAIPLRGRKQLVNASAVVA
jgi:hypothetical protein